MKLLLLLLLALSSCAPVGVSKAVVSTNPKHHVILTTGSSMEVNLPFKYLQKAYEIEATVTKLKRGKPELYKAQIIETEYNFIEINIAPKKFSSGHYKLELKLEDEVIQSFNFEIGLEFWGGKSY